MVSTIKFSQFASGGDLSNGVTTVGLDNTLTINTRFNNPWTFLPSGTTGDRPIPVAAIYYRLRLNTTLRVYEYYDPISAMWTELSGSGTGTVNPGVTNDIPFYPANGTVLSPLAAAANSVLVTSAGSVPSLSTTLPTGLSIPGATITSSTAALTSGQVAATPVNPTDIANKAYVDSAFGSGVTSITGTTNQVIASSPTGAVTLSLPQDIATGSSPTFSTITLSSTTNHAVLIGQAGSAIHSVLLGAGQVLIGTTASDPAAATLSQGQNIGITSISGSITIGFTGNLPVTNLNSGTSASSSTFWRGDGSWATPSGTGVTSVSGTLNRITSTGGTTPVIDISASYVGQTSITTLGTVTTGVWNGTTIAVANGGTGVASVTTSPTATAFSGWDANKNLSANSHIEGYTTTATAAGTTTLTVASTYLQFFTGSTTQTVVLPVTSTLVLGQQFFIANNSSGVVTVQSSGLNNIVAMAANTVAIFTCILTSGTTAASWASDYNASVAGVNSITGTANQVIASASTGAVTLSLPQSIATSSAVQFASVQFSGNNGLLDSNGKEILAINPGGGSAVNYLTLGNAISGAAPSWQATGTDANIGLTFQVKAAATVAFASSTLANYINFSPAATLSPVTISAAGTDTNIGLNLQSKATGQISIISTNASPVIIQSGTTSQHTTTFAMADTANSRTVTFPDANGTLVFSNTGQVVQSVSSAIISGSSTTSTTYVDVTSGSLSITPTSSSNKVLVIFTWVASITNVAATNTSYSSQVLRGATVIPTATSISASAVSGAGGTGVNVPASYVFLDSPATTSSTTYKIQHKSSIGTATATTSALTITLMEIQG